MSYDLYRALRRTTAFIVPSLAISLSLALTAPAVADGGLGGREFVIGGGGTAGVDSPTGPGGNGGNSGSDFAGGGGGGAGAVTGGAGGSGGSFDPTHTAGGSGGVHGYVGGGLPAIAATGTSGSAGQTANLAAGGGGGAGGYGAVVTGAGATGTIINNLVGGNGGAGGTSNGTLDQGGSGGSGGIGLLFTDGSLSKTVTIDATVRGGNGGAAGGGGAEGPGFRGLGGVGIIGSQLNLTMSAGGTVSGGLSGDGVTRADAIRFTGPGSNSISFLGATSGLTGDIANNATDLTLQSPGNVTVANRITGTGRLVMDGPGSITLSAANTYSGSTTISGGTTHLANMGALSTGQVVLGDGRLNGAVTGTLGNAIRIVSSGIGGISASTGQTLTLTGALTGSGTDFRAGHATDNGTVVLSPSSVTVSGIRFFIDGGTVRLGSNGALVTDRATVWTDIAAGATLDINGPATVHGLRGGGTITNDSGAAATLTANNASASTFAGVVRDGTSRTSLTKAGAGVFTLSGANSYGGATTVTAGALQAGAANSFSAASAVNVGTGATLDLNGFNQSIGSLAGSGAVALSTATLTAGGNGTDTSFSGVLSGAGSLTKAGAGVFTLSGANNYSGATTVAAGSLIVNGSIASSSGVTVAPGAMLGGSGQLPSLTVNGTLAPGNSPGTLTVNGNLVLGAGSLYLAEVQGAVADRVNVTGTAALAGTLRLAPLGGAYLFSTPYTLLAAAGGRSGTFGTVDTTGSFGDGVTTAVSYTSNDVQLTLTPKPLAPIVVPPTPTPSPRLGVGRPANAFAVASAIDGAVANGADPSALFGIYNLPAAAIPAAVNSLSGEVHTAAPAMAHVASDQFLRTMLDGSSAGRLAGTSGGPAGATSFTADLPLRQDGPGRTTFDPARFSLWGATFGSTGRNDGDRAVGSANRNLSDAHVAVGADVRLGSNTVAGIAVAGGQSRASLTGGLGKAEADVFQAGLYGRTMLGTLNLAAALGYARLETDTSRAIPVLGRTGVAASYATQAWSGRIEASMPVASWGGLTLSPLAAFQAVRARSPAAVERDGSGATAGMLTLARRSDMTSRSELGLQLDAKMLAGATPVTGFVRATWAHYYQRDADLTAALNGLPGASFAVTGARPDRNAALLAAGADIRLSQTVSLGMRVDSELSGNTRRVGGTAQLRVSF